MTVLIRRSGGGWEPPSVTSYENEADEVHALLDDATVLISVYEPDAEHGWTSGTIERTLRGDGPEEAPR